MIKEIPAHPSLVELLELKCGATMVANARHCTVMLDIMAIILITHCLELSEYDKTRCRLNRP